MSEKVYHFKIGLFLITGAILFLTGVIILGSGQMFKDVFIMETYFDGSVQGIDIGSPIKYRGVKIGEVEEIAVAGSIYPLEHLDPVFQKYNVYVVVRAAINEGAFSGLTKDMDNDRLRKLIMDDGLRVKLMPLGVTGLSYVEVDFVDPINNPPLPIVWEPIYPYIPSVPSTIQQLSESLTGISRSLNDDVLPMLSNLNDSSKNLPDITAQTNTLLKRLNESMVMVRAGVEEFPEITKKANQLIQQLDDIIYNNREEIDETLLDVRKVIRNLKEITREMKHYPAKFFLGSPPETIKEP